jgi:hypothetical protein
MTTLIVDDTIFHKERYSAYFILALQETPCESEETKLKLMRKIEIGVYEFAVRQANERWDNGLYRSVRRQTTHVPQIYQMTSDLRSRYFQVNSTLNRSRT